MNKQDIFGFRYVYGEPTKDKPPYLVSYKVLNNYQVFQSEFNQLMFVIYDNDSKNYYRLERTNNEIDKTDKNIEQWIKILITKD